MIKESQSNKFQFKQMIFIIRSEINQNKNEKEKRVIDVLTIISSHNRQAAPSHGDHHAANSLCRNGNPLLLQGSAQLCQAGFGLLPGPDSHL